MSSSERLAYWYFRLNGFMTIENFVVHPDLGQDVRTDVDILATRFKYRSENVAAPMVDDPKVAECETLVNVILAEIKRGDCALNGPWTNPENQNMQRVLRATGCISLDELESAAQQLYEEKRWSNETATVRLFAFGQHRVDNLDLSLEQQIEWSDVIEFCIERFNAYRYQKNATGQWPLDGKELKRLALSRDEPAIRSYFNL